MKRCEVGVSERWPGSRWSSKKTFRRRPHQFPHANPSSSLSLSLFAPNLFPLPPHPFFPLPLATRTDTATIASPRELLPYSSWSGRHLEFHSHPDWSLSECGANRGTAHHTREQSTPDVPGLPQSATYFLRYFPINSLNLSPWSFSDIPQHRRTTL